MPKPQQISFRIHNGGRMILEQEAHDGAVAIRRDFEDESTVVSIPAAEFVTLLNYYHHRREMGAPIFEEPEEPAPVIGQTST